MDHRHGGGADSKIVQTAPGPLDADGKVEIVVLLDGALLEVFLNNRTVISSFATHVFTAAAASTGPDDRSNFVLTPPAGVTCVTKAWKMKRLTPAPPPAPTPAPAPHCKEASATSPVGMWPCADYDAAAMRWKFVGGASATEGTITLASDPSLALGFIGTDPSSGQPHVALTKGSKVTFKVTGDAIVVLSAPDAPKGAEGRCLDVTAHNELPGASLQAYSCTTTSPNQRWEVAAVGGAFTITSVYDAKFNYGNQCLAACSV